MNTQKIKGIEFKNLTPEAFAGLADLEVVSTDGYAIVARNREEYDLILSYLREQNFYETEADWSTLECRDGRLTWNASFCYDQKDFQENILSWCEKSDHYEYDFENYNDDFAIIDRSGDVVFSPEEISNGIYYFREDVYTYKFGVNFSNEDFFHNGKKEDDDDNE